MPAPVATTLPTTAVVAVIDGDTVDLASGERVRVIGIDTPERGQPCYEPASNAMTSLVLNKQVRIMPGARDDRDRYGRLLRYIDLPDGTDVGLTLIERGFAIARYDSRDGYGAHPREAAYVAADAASAPLCQPPTTPATLPPVPPTTVPRVVVTPPRPSCDPNYSGACVPIASDVDCAGGSGNGPAYVQGPVYVIGVDIYDLDRDGDGVGCEPK